MIKIEALAKDKILVHKREELECTLTNDTDAELRVYICDSDWLHAYVLDPKVRNIPAWIRKGENVISAFNVKTGECIEVLKLNLTGSLRILIAPH